MKKKKFKLPSKDVIEQKKSKLKNELEKLKSQKYKSPIYEFLDEIKDIIKEYLEDGLSYRKISFAIEKTFSIRISETTIRAYAHNVLGISRKKSSKISKSSKKENIINTPSKNISSNEQSNKDIENNSVRNSHITRRKSNFEDF